LRFRRALARPERAQARLLARRMAANAETAYGRAHGFARVDSLAAFQRHVPVTDYDALEPWLARARAAEPNVLTREPVRLFERSGGSTGTTTKLIPYTASLLADFGAATGPWLAAMYRAHALVGTRAYWSLSPVAQGARTTAGGIPIGMADDSEYFGVVRRFVIAKTMAVPPTVARAPDFAAWRHATLVHLLQCEDLGLVSVWSPTFLSVLLGALASDPQPVLAALPPARAAEVRAALADAPSAFGPRVWPRLALVSCWTDGPAAAHVEPLRALFPGVAIEPKGLLATEGVVSIPYGPGPGGALALTSHVLEMIDLDRPDARPLWPHELRVGGAYSPLLTTGGGLYRYHLKDVVTCVAPLRVRFVGKLDQVADIVGEKVHARQVEVALADAGRALGAAWDFALLAPIAAPDAAPSYCLYLESAADDGMLAAVGRHLDAHLMTGHAYRYCRDLGQLGALRIQRVRDGRARALAALVASGLRAGDIKPTVLDARPLWAATFGVGQPLPDHAEDRR
ncbi:MAG: GH3 auxin-responsive promoter family protein, partial [Myxococcota bacterium]